MIIPHIEEMLLGPESREKTIQLLGDNKRELVNGHLWHYIAYAGESKHPIIHQASSDPTEIVKPRISLASHLKNYNRIGIYDLLYLSTLYPILLPESFVPEKQKPVKRFMPLFFRRLLQIGKGQLLYYHQIEIIYSMLTNKSHLEAIQFRRDWNLKKEYTSKIAGDLMIAKNYSLLDLIHEYALNDTLHFYQANYYGAYSLANYIGIRTL